MDASYASQLVAMRNTTPSASSASRCWYWQTCNEFGFYQARPVLYSCTRSLRQTGDSPRQAFSSSIKLPYFTGLCTEVFGVSASTVQRNIDKTLSYYGGRNIKCVLGECERSLTLLGSRTSSSSTERLTRGTLSACSR